MENEEVLLGDELKDSKVTSIENEIIKGYKDFTITDGSATTNLRVTEPSNSEQEIISDQYSRKYTELLSGGSFLLWEELKNKLMVRGVWTEKDETFIDDVTEQMKDIVRSVLKFTEGEEYNKEIVQNLRDKYFEHKREIERFTEKRVSFYNNTIESKANEFAIKHKMLLCIKNEDGTSYFKSIEEINTFRNRQIINKILSTCLTFWAGIPQELLSNAPEDDLIFGGRGLHMLLGNSDGE